MVNSAEQIEKNVSASFGYVKKDMLMLNDALSDVHDKIQHLSMNNAALLDEVRKVSVAVGKLGVGKTSVKKVKAKVKKVKAKKKVVKKKVKKAKVKKAKVKKKARKSSKKSGKGNVKKVVKTEEIVYS